MIEDGVGAWRRDQGGQAFKKLDPGQVDPFGPVRPGPLEANAQATIGELLEPKRGEGRSRDVPGEALPRTGSPENRRSAQRENETANALARRGFRVEQLPEGTVGPLGGSPDYKVNGRLWDCYAPGKTTLDNIRTTISGKVRRQAPRVILNIGDLKTHTLEDIAQRLRSAPVKGLEELWALDGDELLEFVDGSWRRVV